MGFHIDYGNFEFLFTAKELYDHDLLDKVLKTSGILEVSEDYYGLAWDGVESVFADTRQYYSEETGIETLVFFDPVITEFYRLCAMYEVQKGIGRHDDSFRREVEKDVYQCFCLSSYGFDVLLRDDRKGGPKLVFLSGEEFCGLSELPGALAEARDVFKNRCARLKKMLALENSQMNTPVNMQKEAA